MHEGYEVRLVVNITDVNDKIYDAARGRRRAERRRSPQRMIDAYRADTDALGLGRPDDEPLASETMDAIIDYIRALVDGGHAYAVDGDVYFRVRSDEQYGSLSHRRIEDMDQGEGVEGAERKQDPLDFALWKARKEGEDTLVGVALGGGPARLAHRVLGDGRAAARRRLRDPRRRLGPAVPPPRERGLPDAGGARARAGEAVDAQRDDADDRREDGQVGGQHRAAARGARRATTPPPSSCT